MSKFSFLSGDTLHPEPISLMDSQQATVSITPQQPVLVPIRGAIPSVKLGTFFDIARNCQQSGEIVSHWPMSLNVDMHAELVAIDVARISSSQYNIIFRDAARAYTLVAGRSHAQRSRDTDWIALSIRQVLEHLEGADPNADLVISYVGQWQAHFRIWTSANGELLHLEPSFRPTRPRSSIIPPAGHSPSSLFVLARTLIGEALVRLKNIRQLALAWLKR